MDQYIQPENLFEEPKENLLPKKRFSFLWWGIGGGFLVLICLGIFYTFPPSNFPQGSIVTVKNGDTLSRVARELESRHIVRSAVLFQSISIFIGGDRHILQGDYFFDEPESVWKIASRILSGNHNISQIKITFPEGYTHFQMADLLSSKIPNFDKESFINETKKKEGYLFPDTYFFFSAVTVSEIVEALRFNFERKLEPLRADIRSSGRSEKDIIIMASLIEREATGDEDRAVISGILWNRLGLGIRLQVDATVLYALGKNGDSHVSLEDLKVNSPYNTYRVSGLPPAPIANPGIKAIQAALYPVSSSYLFYLHDKNGMIHYAKTFEEHKKNKERYLN